jgi:coatomer protein complex subunit epsilon
MDPFSAEGELLNLHNHFHQGQWQEVIDFDTTGLSPENALPARVLSLRAQIALGQAEDVIADVQGEQEPDLAAVGALAELAAGNEAKAVTLAEKLAQESADNATVQVLAGTVLQAAGKSEEALALLSQHQGNCMLTFMNDYRHNVNLYHSGSSCSDCPDPTTTESHRSRDQGGTSCEKMGPG